METAVLNSENHWIVLMSVPDNFTEMWFYFVFMLLTIRGKILIAEVAKIKKWNKTHDKLKPQLSSGLDGDWLEVAAQYGWNQLGRKG